MNANVANQDMLDEELVRLGKLYYRDPVIYANQILRGPDGQPLQPDDQQSEVLYKLRDNKVVTVKSGRGAGKTYDAGVAIWWFLCTRYNAQVYVTAASGGTIQGGIWPTISELHQNMHPLYKDDFEVQVTQVKSKEYPNTWFCVQRTAKKENPEAMAGAHNLNMMYVIDEASGVDDAIFKSIMGSLTEDDNFLLLLSNPRRLSGFFYDSFKTINNTIYTQITMSAVKSKFVSQKSIDRWKTLYGEDSNAYKIHVLGEFPTREDDSIIPWDMVNAAAERNPDKCDSDGMLYWALDVAAGGGDKSVLMQRRGNVIYDNIVRYNEKDTMVLVGKVINKYFNLKEENRPDKIMVDSVAIGKGPYDRLKEEGLPVVAAIAHEIAYDKKFNLNQKAEWWTICRDWFRDELVSIPNDIELIEQLTTVRSTFHSSGRFQVEAKKVYRKRNPAIGSPDTADSCVMLFFRKKRHKSELLFI